MTQSPMDIDDAKGLCVKQHFTMMHGEQKKQYVYTIL